MALALGSSHSSGILFLEYLAATVVVAIGVHFLLERPLRWLFIRAGQIASRAPQASPAAEPLGQRSAD